MGRAVVADALRETDPARADDAERDTNWRRGYVVHFRRLVEAGLASKEDAVVVARNGLESLHGRMRVRHADGEEAGLGSLLRHLRTGWFSTVTVAAAGQAAEGLSLPYHGDGLRGDALLRRLEVWVDNGVIEPSCAAAVRTVAAHRSGSACPAARSSCSGQAPRWARSRRC